MLHARLASFPTRPHCPFVFMMVKHLFQLTLREKTGCLQSNMLGSSVSDTVLFCTPLRHVAFRVLFSPPKQLFNLMLIIHHHSILSIIIHIVGFSRYRLIFVYLGHTLLERYGMTEIGMALSNPLHGPRLPVRHPFNPCSLTRFIICKDSHSHYFFLIHVHSHFL